MKGKRETKVNNIRAVNRSQLLAEGKTCTRNYTWATNDIKHCGMRGKISDAVEHDCDATNTIRNRQQDKTWWLNNTPELPPGGRKKNQKKRLVQQFTTPKAGHKGWLVQGHNPKQTRLKLHATIERLWKLAHVGQPMSYSTKTKNRGWLSDPLSDNTKYVTAESE